LPAECYNDLDHFSKSQCRIEANEKNCRDSDSQIIPPGSLIFFGQVLAQQESGFDLAGE
jgi:hypothetical protein